MAARLVVLICIRCGIARTPSESLTCKACTEAIEASLKGSGGAAS